MTEQLTDDGESENRAAFNDHLNRKIKTLDALLVRKRIKNAMKCNRDYVFLFNMKPTKTTWFGKVVYNISDYDLDRMVRSAKCDILAELKLSDDHFRVMVCPTTIAVCMTWNMKPYEKPSYATVDGMQYTYKMCYD